MIVQILLERVYLLGQRLILYLKRRTEVKKLKQT